MVVLVFTVTCFVYVKMVGCRQVCVPVAHDITLCSLLCGPITITVFIKLRHVYIRKTLYCSKYVRVCSPPPMHVEHIYTKFKTQSAHISNS